MPELVPLGKHSAERAAAPLLKRLGAAADAERLRLLLPLIEDQRIRLDRALAALFEGKSREDGLAAFAAFRSRVNGVAGDLPLRIEVDEFKSDPATRHAWFVGLDPTEANVEAMGEVSTREPGAVPAVAPEGVSALLNRDGSEVPKLRIFVSYSHKNLGSVTKLLGLLDDQFGCYKRDLPVEFLMDRRLTDDGRWDLRSDQEWMTSLGEKMAAADFGLLMCSTSFFASRFIRQVELPNFGIGRAKAGFAVGLEEFDLMEKDIKASLGGSQVLVDGKKRFFADVEKHKSNSVKWARGLYLQIDERLKESPPVPAGSSRPLVTVPIYRKSADFQRFAEELAEDRFVEHFQIPNGDTPTQSRVDALEYLARWRDDPDSPPVLYVLGEYGIGKTTTLKRFAQQMLAERDKDASKPLPIFIDLRQLLLDGKGTVPGQVHEVLDGVLDRNYRSSERPEVSADDILRLVREQRAVLIFDGLDEKTVHLLPDQARAFIRVLWQALPEMGHVAREKRSGKDPSGKDKKAPAGPVGRLIISCRTHYFRTFGEQTSMLTGEGREGIDPSQERTPVLTILPFTEEQIKSYLLGVCDGDGVKADAAWELLGSVHNLRDLSTRPYLLSRIVDRLDTVERFRREGETVNAARLYDAFVDDWFARDDGKHSIRPDHKRLLMEGLAAKLWRDGVKELPPDKLDTFLDRFLYEAPAIERGYLNKDRQVLLEDLRTACFVLREDTREGRSQDVRSAFRFAHTSLQEFFLAKWLVRALDEDRSAGWDLPTVSLETFDFVGQLLEVEPEPMRRKWLGRLGEWMGREPLGTAELAFRYWLRGRERRWPVPVPKQVRLPGCDFEELRLCGEGPGQPLDLRGANLAGAKFNRARLRDVEMSGADLRGSEWRQGVWERVSAAGVQWGEADLAGLRWRRGTAAGGEDPDWTGVRLLHVEGGGT
jgi:hypothetical protein